MSYRLGIDVGGTNTDAVLVDADDAVTAAVKRPTTADVTRGIVEALDAVLETAAVAVESIDAAMLGTTHCANAITEREGLDEVGVLRFGAPATESVPPLVEWPDDLEAAIGGHVAVLSGGHEYDGREVGPLDEAAVRETARRFADDGADAFAVVGTFSPVRGDHEAQAAEIIDDALRAVPVSRSNEIGSIGLLERENSTVLNAALGSVARHAATAFREAMAERGLDAALYFGQNDGTLMDVDYAVEYPIHTVASGPSNSIRGAAYLSGIEDGIVVDVGGTTTDVGAVADGYPRRSAVAVEIGGVETNFRMPDLVSVGLGGGSVIDVDETGVTVGPESVGYRLFEAALAFGGDTATTTDAAVAAGRADVGTAEPDVDDDLVESVERVVGERLEEAIDRIKTSPGPRPVVAVGGGSFLVPDDLAGASEVVRPRHFAVANAVGAAIAQVSGHVDRVFSLADRTREEALQEARESAKANAVAAGADPDTVEVVAVEEVALSYLPGNAVRVRVRAAGELADV